ncbi:ATP-dependent protease La domain protein, partial [Tanacetum coccineum]
MFKLAYYAIDKVMLCWEIRYSAGPSILLEVANGRFKRGRVLVPSETKTLHLFEARYLKLLDECLFKKKKLFVHFVLDPIVVSSTSTETSFAARYGCLVVIDKVEQLDVGALVTIRGIGRVTLVKFAKSEPFLEGVVLPLQDNVPQNESEISSKVLELKEALNGLNSLEIKLKAGKDEPLQTQTTNSLEWALKEPSLDCEESFIPSFAERVSFAALQNMS